MASPDVGDWKGTLAVTGLGLVTPVGLDARSSIAALRAGVSRLSQLPHFQIEVDQGELGPVTGGVVPRLAGGRHGVQRISRLLRPALADVVEDAALRPGMRVGVVLGTSGNRPGGRRIPHSRVLRDALLDAFPEGVELTAAHLVPLGRAAVLNALRPAARILEAGTVDLVLVGAADSWISPRALAWLRAEGKLAEYPRRTGTMPGEAAGFLALETPGAAARRQARVYAHVVASSGRHEPVPYGEASNAVPLADAIRAVWAGVEDRHILMITDQNGERYRATEFCFAEPKALNDYRTMQWLTPADCIGDPGAAAGAVTLAWAAMALHQGYARTPRALVWGASDEGAREAVHLAAHGGGA